MEIATTTEIGAPPERVWAVMSDVERWHEWTASIKSVELLDGGPLRVGSRARVRQPGFPPVTWTVTELVDGRSFTWQSRTPGLRSTGVHSVRPAGDGSTAELTIRQEGRLEKLAAKLFGKKSRRFVEMEGEGLRRRVESAPS